MFKTFIMDINFEDVNYVKIFQASEKLLPAKQGKIPTELSGIIKLLKISYISLSHFLKIEGERKKINDTIIRFFSRNRKPREKKFSIFKKGVDEVFSDMPKL